MPRTRGSRFEANDHDVLIIGGGGAGLRAAIAVAETNPKLNIAVISKVYPMRSHMVSAEGGAAAVIKPNDSLDDHAYDTISGGDWLCDQDAVDVFVKLDIAEAIRPHGNDDALLRWNTCAYHHAPKARAAGGGVR